MNINYISKDCNLVNALNKLGIKQLNPMQVKVLNMLSNKKNICISAPTGTGKTICFLIPLLKDIEKNSYTQAIILVPTNILADQIYSIIKKIIDEYKQYLTVKVVKTSIQSIKKTYKGTSNNILIGTPDNIVKLLYTKNKISLLKLKYFVIDEIDYILEDDFIKQLDAIYNCINLNKVQIIMSTATINNHIKSFIKKYIRNVRIVEFSDSTKKTSFIFEDITGIDKLEKLNKVINFYNPYLCIIFANTINTVEAVYKFLKNRSFNVCMIHGSLQTRKRKKIITDIQNNEYQYIVATDIFSRGIDVNNISLIINYELPSIKNMNFFIHRSGRTGRINCEIEGVVYTFYQKNEMKKITWIKKKGIQIKKQKIELLCKE